jgi:hypothetical protein
VEDPDVARGLDVATGLDLAKDLDAARGLDLARNLSVARDLDLAKDLSVARNLDLPRNLDVARDLDVAGDSGFAGGLDVAEDPKVAVGSEVAEGFDAAEDLDVAGDSDVAKSPEHDASGDRCPPRNPGQAIRRVQAQALRSGKSSSRLTPNGQVPRFGRSPGPRRTTGRHPVSYTGRWEAQPLLCMDARTRPRQPELMTMPLDSRIHWPIVDSPNTTTFSFKSDPIVTYR